MVLKQEMIGSREEWTFLDKSTRDYTHAIHLYPARMHPEIAKRIIEKYAIPDTIVFDPFMGSGGVLLEGILAGHDSIGLDINPFAVLLSKVKTTPINTDLVRMRRNILERSTKDHSAAKIYPDILPNMDIETWYGADVADKLAVLKHHIFNMHNKDAADFFKVCFSLVARKSSYQRNGAWKMHRMRNRDEFRPDPFDMFAKVSMDNIERMKTLTNATPAGKAYPIFGDTRNAKEIITKNELGGKINLMVTSPPYGDHHTTVAYGQFVRHSSLWLDLPSEHVMKIDKTGLGGRIMDETYDLDSETLDTTLNAVRKNDVLLTKNKKPCRTEEVYAFFHDLDYCMGQIVDLMERDQSTCCFVVANRTVRRIHIPTDVITVELGRKWGYKLETIIKRQIPNKVMPTKNAPENEANNIGSTMTEESVIILKC